MSPIGFRDFFLVTFADAIKPVSLMERQSLKPYISTRYTKVTKSVQESFEYSFNAPLNGFLFTLYVVIKPKGV